MDLRSDAMHQCGVGIFTYYHHESNRIEIELNRTIVRNVFSLYPRTWNHWILTTIQYTLASITLPFLLLFARSFSVFSDRNFHVTMCAMIVYKRHSTLSSKPFIQQRTSARNNLWVLFQCDLNLLQLLQCQTLVGLLHGMYGCFHPIDRIQKATRANNSNKVNHHSPLPFLWLAKLKSANAYQVEYKHFATVEILMWKLCKGVRSGGFAWMTNMDEMWIW